LEYLIIFLLNLEPYIRQIYCRSTCKAPARASGARHKTGPCLGSIRSILVYMKEHWWYSWRKKKNISIKFQNITGEMKNIFCPIYVAFKRYTRQAKKKQALCESRH